MVVELTIELTLHVYCSRFGKSVCNTCIALHAKYNWCSENCNANCKCIESAFYVLLHITTTQMLDKEKTYGPSCSPSTFLAVACTYVLNYLRTIFYNVIS